MKRVLLDSTFESGLKGNPVYQTALCLIQLLFSTIYTSPALHREMMHLQHLNLYSFLFTLEMTQGLLLRW